MSDSDETRPWIRDRDGVLSFLRAHLGQVIEVDTSTILQGPVEFQARVADLGHDPGHVKLVKEAHLLFFYLSEIFAVRETLQTTSHAPSAPDGWVRGDDALAEFFARNVGNDVEIRQDDGAVVFTKVRSLPYNGLVWLPGAGDAGDVLISRVERARLAPTPKASTPPEPAADSACEDDLLVTAQPPLGLKDDELIFWRAAVLAAVPLSERVAEDEPWRNIPVDFADSVVLACRERIKPDTLAETDEAAEPSEDVDWFTGPGEAICEVCDVVSEGPFQRVYIASCDEWCRLCNACAAEGTDTEEAAALRRLKAKMRKRERENPENLVCHSGPSYTTFDDAGEPVTFHRRAPDTAAHLEEPATSDSAVVFERRLALAYQTNERDRVERSARIQALEQDLEDHYRAQESERAHHGETTLHVEALLDAAENDRARICELTTTLETLHASHEQLLQERAEPAPQTETGDDPNGMAAHADDAASKALFDGVADDTGPHTATFTDSVDPLQTLAARSMAAWSDRKRNDSASEVPRRECRVVTQPGAPDLEDTARELVACSWYRHVEGMAYAVDYMNIPGLTSPATLGCIEHVLLREAWGKDVCIDVDEEKSRNLYCCTITVIDDCLLSELRRKGGTPLEARAKALVAVLCAAPPKGGA